MSFYHQFLREIVFCFIEPTHCVFQEISICYLRLIIMIPVYINKIVSIHSCFPLISDTSLVLQKNLKTHRRYLKAGVLESIVHMRKCQFQLYMAYSDRVIWKN